MNSEPITPVVLKAPVHKERTWLYPWIGVLFGLILGFFIGHPLSMLVHNIYNHIMLGNPIDASGALFRSFHWHMWPMMAIFSLFGAIGWGFIGFILQRLREGRLRLDTLHREFELQVATLRHHYKNLALGIHGFSSRIRRKLTHLEETMERCLSQGECPPYTELQPVFKTLEHNFSVLEDAAQRLTHTLGREVLFLKALTSDTLTPTPREFYPFLRHCIEDLKGLRFRDKLIEVQIDGTSCESCRGSLVFPFEPYTMEVILQNIIGNAMRYGDRIDIGVQEAGGKVIVEIQDNGPGLEVEKLRQHLLVPEERRGAQSTHLGIEVTLHLLEKCGGRLLAWSKPGAGARFILEFPRHPPGTW